MSPRVESIQIGRSRYFLADSTDSKPWSSAIIKETITGVVTISEFGIAGDEQADLVHHGGHDKAILAYDRDHYEFWKSQYPTTDFHAGGFGENLTVSGISEMTCCIGDIFEVGSCLLQVSQPRQPCWKLSKRWALPDLARTVQNLRKTGWFLRVIRTGVTQAGDSMVLIDRPHPSVTVAQALDVMYAQPRNHEHDLALAGIPQLSEAWKLALTSRADK